jgi:UDP-N-acetylglucosamine diphosphorylase/glucosamine-1-phosphate N-acetyltransferase
MKIDLCLYENENAGMLEPLALTRPVFSLLCGTKNLFAKIVDTVGLAPRACFVRNYLQETVRSSYLGIEVNSSDWLVGRDCVLFVDGAWIPPFDFQLKTDSSHAGICSGKPVYYYCTGEKLASFAEIHDNLDLLESLRLLGLPEKKVAGVVLEYLWDLVGNNEAQIIADMNGSHELSNPSERPTGLIGPLDQLFTHAKAEIEPLVAFDTSKGPVVIESGAKIQAFTRLEGPCFIGKDTQIFGAKIRAGTSIGTNCRIGGEIENSIILGYTNKYHDGFLGHSYLGEWVNWGAATNASDLRNDYGPVKVQVDGQLINTGLNKVGVFFGDHSRTSIGVLLNTGSNIGAFANLLPGGLLPRNIPAFASSKNGKLVPGNAWEILMQIASIVMQRRQRELSAELQRLYQNVFHLTASQRKKIPFEPEIPFNRKSA